MGAGARATGRTLALNSMENRVYDIEMEWDEGVSPPSSNPLLRVDPSRVITKFYRPGRWTRETILEEHAFTLDLERAEVPAVPPLMLANGSTLEQSEEGFLFAVFPKVRGRILQELDDSRLQQVGRLLARLHNVGATKPAPHRLRLTPETYGWRSLEFLEASGLIHENLRVRYRQVVEEVLKTIEPKFSDVPTFRLHGDCHLGNVLWQETSPFFLDFDDMVTGPAVQDIWLIVRGRDEEAQRQREVLIGSYESMREFDRSTLDLIEPLRALRIVHYSAWIARRWEDPTFKNAFPDFNTYKYWFEELNDLDEQLRLMMGRD